MPRRTYDKQFKIQAVKLVMEDEFSVKEVSEQLEVHHNSLYRWVSEYENMVIVRFMAKVAHFLICSMKIRS